MRSFMDNKNSFRRTLEPTIERFVSAEHVASLSHSQYENIDRIEFSPPKMGDSTFGKFKVTYKTPVLCELNR